MATTHPDLIQDLLDFIACPASDADDAAFNALALRLFAHQVRHNPAYARFCQSRGRTRRRCAAGRTSGGAGQRLRSSR